ncbi:MAG TPA: beta-galactosidase, partial [Planctomycetota bacterium]|nr:beta-galactosidase [Planctomycetota bacterium]
MTRILALLWAWVLGGTPAGQETIWVEGEAAARHSFQKHGWYDDVRKDVLSAGDWLSNYGPKPGEAAWAVDVKEGGPYVFWVRCNNLFVTQEYRIDDGPWTACDLSSEPREEMMISPKPDHRSLSWNRLGTVTLEKGARTVSFRISSKLQNHGGIDCFVLTNAGFVPSGARKPGAVAAAKPEDWFEVTADDDPFSPESIIDLWPRLPKPAGKAGFVQRRGAELVQGGRPVKFWGCGANLDPSKPRPWNERWARWLAKHGVNMVRQHTVDHVLGPLRRSGGVPSFDPARLDAWDAWCATLKKNGIHMTWSMFYPYHVTPEDGYELFDDLPGDGKSRSSSGLATIEPKLQDLEFEYVKTLLLHKNPYTGLRYVDDPALAVLEIRNEDSIFWHYPLNDLMTGKLAPRHAERLRGRWAAWLKARYGSTEKLKAAWGEGARSDDAVDNTSMKGYAAWEMEAAGPHFNKREKKRMGDWIRFLAEAQRDGYARREKALRELGFKGVTVSTAWRAGGPAADPANVWTDDAMDMIDRHNYMGGGEGGHSVKEGKVHAETHLGTPGGGLLAVGLYQIEDKPFSITEWTQLPPNPWKAEAAPLIAFYGMGLQGWDASYHFLSS